MVRTKKWYNVERHVSHVLSAFDVFCNLLTGQRHDSMESVFHDRETIKNVNDVICVQLHVCPSIDLKGAVSRLNGLRNLA